MIRKLSLIVGLWLLLSTGAGAATLADSDSTASLEAILSAPDLTVEDYELGRDELQTFYVAREFKPVWSFAGPDGAAAFTAFLDSIGQAIDYHGLVRQDYALELMRKLAANTDDRSHAELELLVTDTLLRLAHNLHGDSVDLSDLYVGWNFERSEIDIPSSLSAAIDAGKLNDFINSLGPKNLAYLQLAKALKTYREIAANGNWTTIDPGPALRPKDHSPRVIQLRMRLIAEKELPQEMPPQAKKDVFDQQLYQALQSYQEWNGLDVDGHLGAKTVEALNVPVGTRIAQIRANMERWRHMPEDFPGDRYTLVNIPEASITIFEKGGFVYRGIVIVGRVDRKTPFIQSTIRSMIINPAWHVPAKIARKDILPKLRKDPHYLEKMGFTIRGNEEDPHGNKIDWSTMPDREFNFRLRQSPGDMNSLGRLKFDFDNDFAVYMHGTPHQELFKKNMRDLSSGCIRLHDPAEVAQIILADNPGDWTVDKINQAIDTGNTHWMAISNPMPLYVTYWTVFTDESGHINFRNDVYDYDEFLMKTLESESSDSK